MTKPRRVLTTKYPPSFVKSMDRLVKQNGTFSCRSDVIRDAWKDFKKLNVDDLFDFKEFELVPCRFSVEDAQEIIQIYNYSKVLQIAVALFILKHLYGVI